MTVDTEAATGQRFEVGPQSELNVSNVSGSVAVTAEDGSEIVVRSNKRGSGKAHDSTQVEVHKEGNRVSVQTRSAAAGLINFGRSSSVDYVITVPRDCRLRLHAVSADVQVSGSRSDVGIQTVSGDVNIRNVAGDITVTTISGDVTGESLTGTLVGRTTSGDCAIMSSRFRRFSLTTVSGDFRIQTPLTADEHYYAKSVSGDLDLLVPADTGATVQLKSLSGSVQCELPAEIIKSGRRHWSGRINGGGSNVEMNSVSGDLRIRKSQATDREHVGAESAGSGTDWRPVPPVAPVRPVRPVPPMSSGATQAEGRPDASTAEEGRVTPDTAAILQQLERGELSVDEAMAQLESLDRDR